MKKILYIILSMIITFSFPLTVFAEHENTNKNTGELAKDIAAVAATQIGYTESTESPKYGNIKGSYAAAFISWCAYEARIADEIIIKTNSLSEMYAFFAYGNRIESDPAYVPECGDILFMGSEDNVTSAAIVTGSDSQYVTAIVCDTDMTVKKKQYSLDLEKLIGYATPDYDYKREDAVGKHMTTASFLNFREKPTTSSAVITQIPMGTIVDILAISDDWGQIEYDGVVGWISMSYVVPYDDSHTDTSTYGVNWNIIDVSRWQGHIDWNKISNANIQGVIFRIGLRGTKTRELLLDEKFFEYYNGAKSIGLHVGCYFYSAATSVSDAREEAIFVIRTIKDNDIRFDMPVYLDLEENMTYKTGKENVRAITSTYLNLMDQANIYAGIYCNKNWAETFYTPDMFASHPLWIAQYGEKCTYTGPYGMWQYTDKGSVSGIEENYTDLNLCYINYPQIIIDYHYNQNITEPSITITGDVNGDGNLTAADARLALRISANLESASEEAVLAADVDKNGKVTAADARRILRASAGLEKL